MDRHIPEFYHPSFDNAPSGKFHEVILLDRTSKMSWDEILEKVPNFPRGWFELAHLESEDRIDFTCCYWLTKFSYQVKLNASLERFFRSLDDIAIFLIQQKAGQPFRAEMVYSLADNGGFYRGGQPASEADLDSLKRTFADFLLPADYIAFLQIHNGWWKTTDSTGLMSTGQIPENFMQFQNLLASAPTLSTCSGAPVNPKKLIPFYKSFGMPYFQCFWAEWFPEDEIGNVYYSSATKCISTPPRIDADMASETMSFPTFGQWLAFYLERVG